MVNILQTIAQDWRYVSEGGATIVFSYVGPQHPDLHGKVLRLRKSSTPDALLPRQDHNATVYSTGLEREDPIIEYQTMCIQRLIPPEHLPHLQSVAVHRSWLENFANYHNLTRPGDRRQKNGVDLGKSRAVLATDLVGGHWLAVEIKPKWGFLPLPTHLSEETKDIKLKTCRFCMHSHLRAQQKGRELTDYCPLDLYSGQESRVRKAILSLWDAWLASNATINNLKIFAGGKFLTPSECHLMLGEFQTAGIESDAIRDAFVSALIQPLLQTPVLRILSDLQRSLDPLDIEGLSKLWKLTESAISRQGSQGSEAVISPTPLGAMSPYFQLTEPTISDWTKFLDIYSFVKRPDLDCTLSFENLHYYLLAYLLSATFKDCSVIVKLDYLRVSTPFAATTSLDSVTVIDLDPKSLRKLSDWENLDRKIVRAYASVKKKVCIDAWKGSDSISC